MSLSRTNTSSSYHSLRCEERNLILHQSRRLTYKTPHMRVSALTWCTRTHKTHIPHRDLLSGWQTVLCACGYMLEAHVAWKIYERWKHSDGLPDIQTDEHLSVSSHTRVTRSDEVQLPPHGPLQSKQWGTTFPRAGAPVILHTGLVNILDLATQKIFIFTICHLFEQSRGTLYCLNVD